MKTRSAKPDELAAERSWHVIDAGGRPLGRVAGEVARLLLGKHRPNYTPHLDCGDHVIVVNAAKVALTGRKAEQEFYYRHSGYPGGLRAVSMGALRDKHPDRLLRQAVRGMLPKTVLGRAALGRLRVYPGAEHPHRAQKPQRHDF